MARPMTRRQKALINSALSAIDDALEGTDVTTNLIDARQQLERLLG